MDELDSMMPSTKASPDQKFRGHTGKFESVRERLGQEAGDATLRPVTLVLFMFLVFLIVRTAWLSEDSYISWRVVDNFTHGFGLRWNILDRVQVFTDPLFVLIVAAFYAVTHEIFITVTLLCIAFSSCAVYLVLKRLAVSHAAALAALAALLSSRAFIDYSTSGLENPLSYLLAALFYAVYLRSKVFDLRTTALLVFILSLVGLNRLDLVLLFLPPLLLALYSQVIEQRTPILRLAGSLVLASSPLWIWLLFSIIYYGFPFPNTYYAKLHTGIPPGDLLFQGVLYYLDALNRDSVTLLTIACALWVAVRKKETRALAAACGIFLYLVYIMKIGGDFMTGRFFSVPFLAAVVLLVWANLRPMVYLALAVCFLGVGLLVQRPVLFADQTYFRDATPRDVIDHTGVADERGFIYQSSGLLPVLQRNRLETIAFWADKGRTARKQGLKFDIFGNIGFYGFYAGPQEYILDPFALGDPLLSKLPIAHKIRKDWRIGHFERDVPAGYAETIQSGTNQIKDPRIAQLYDVIKEITEGPIWSWHRFVEIWRINTGHYRRLMRVPRTTPVAPPHHPKK
jgi:arabinofuranosyltransferase